MAYAKTQNGATSRVVTYQHKCVHMYYVYEYRNVNVCLHYHPISFRERARAFEVIPRRFVLHS